MRDLTGWSALVVPSIARGRGTGHLKRSIALVRSLRELGREAFLYLGERGEGDFTLEELLREFPIDPSFVFSAEPGARAWTLVVLDRFRTSAGEFLHWAGLAPIVGLDEGGPLRSSFDYLLDLLPSLPDIPGANLTAPGLLDAPRRRRGQFPRVHFSERDPLRVLVTFGGEDPAGLSLPAAFSLSSDTRVSVDLLRPPLFPPIGAMERIRVLEPLPDLRERLADYELVVTQFGLTAFESARARVPVLLVSPTAYHEALSRNAGFRSAGVGPRAASRVRDFIDSMRDLIERTAAAAPPADDPSADGSSDDSIPGFPLARRIAGFSFPAGARCPLCSAREPSGSKVLARFPDRTYRRCGSCGLVFLTRTEPPPIAYARDYFFNDYKKQYGVTYLEDFPKLRRMGLDRARRIRSLLKKPHSEGPSLEDRQPRLLDIGCAYGPFLSAAAAEGFSCFGVDPAEDAVRYVKGNLGLPARAGFFPTIDPAAAFGVETFDAVVLWYVIEHFSELGAALQAVSRLLASGGVFAFSTPSGGGVSARIRPAEFFRHSPADHYSIWEPRKTASLLRRYGFRLEKIVVTGHHPERFPGLSGAGKDGILYAGASAASRLFGLGDTFEAYAVKEGSGS